MKTFEVKDYHIKLLKHMYVGWDDCEFGAPCINPKRPYGNSDVIRDMCEIIDDFDLSAIEQQLEESGLSRKLHKLLEEKITLKQEQMRKIHEEMETVLQILLCYADTGISVGKYVETTYGAWKKVESNND